MTTTELAVTTLILLYSPVCAFVVWRLFPRLSPTARRLAMVFLVAQMLLLLRAPEVDKPPTIDPGGGRIWSIDSERVIPSAVASAQLFLVAAVALFAAVCARVRPHWYRLYLLAMAALFLFLAYDEYFLFHDHNKLMATPFGVLPWEIVYALLGAIVVAVTLLVARASPRPALKWHLCLLFGLAIGAGGALALEQLRFAEICPLLGPLYSNECKVYVVEEAMEFLGMWLVLVAVLGQLTAVAPRPGRALRWLLYLAPLAWLMLIPTRVEFQIVEVLTFWLALVALADLPAGRAPGQSRRLRQIIGVLFTLWLAVNFLPRHLRYIEYLFFTEPAAVVYESGIELPAWRVEQNANTVAVSFFAESHYWYLFRELGFSLHLVDQASGSSIAGVDASARRLDASPYRKVLDFQFIYSQALEIDIPPDAPRNRALWLVLTSWRQDGDQFTRQRIESSDRRLLSDTQVIMRELVLRAPPTAATDDPLATFVDGFRLQAVAMPANVSAGRNLEITFTWRSDSEGDQDFGQFLHLRHAETDAYWGFDQAPLGARLPTRLWYSGLADSETWAVPLPADLAPGRYEVYTGLYAQDNLERLPVSDAVGTPFVDARLPLGTLTVEAA